LYEKANERKPKNFFDLKIYTNVRELSFETEGPVKRCEVPAIPGAFLLTNVLSAADCCQLRGMALSMGFELDVPVGGETD